MSALFPASNLNFGDVVVTTQDTSIGMTFPRVGGVLPPLNVAFVQANVAPKANAQIDIKIAFPSTITTPIAAGFTVVQTLIDGNVQPGAPSFVLRPGSTISFVLQNTSTTLANELVGAATVTPS